MKRLSNTGRTRGFTLLELMISVTVLGILARMLIGASEATSRLTSTGNIEAKVLRESERAMKHILTDLRRSGFQTVAGRDYPCVFDAGTPPTEFVNWTYTPAPRTATPGDSDYGPMRSIVLCLPSDLDADGRPELDADSDGTPELDANGDGVPTDDPTDVGALWDPTAATIDPETRLVWTHQDVGYGVVVGPDGRHELVRKVGGAGGPQKTIARDIERVQFDTPVSSGFQIPSGTVRVQLFFRVLDADGHIHRSRTEATVRLRN